MTPIKKRVLNVLLIAGVACLVIFIGLFIYLATPTQPGDPYVEIEKGRSLREISLLLESKGIIRHSLLFLVYATGSGKGKKLKAGEYFFDHPVSPGEVLDTIAEGKIMLHRVKIVEGWNLEQTAKSFSDLKFVQGSDFAKEFLRLARDPFFIKNFGLSVTSLEGYLLPDTYSFPRGSTPQDFLKTFVGAFQEFYEKSVKALKVPAPLPQHQIVTLASIIERETGNEEEKPLIASVFYNRLKIKMPLQSDPTVIYGLKNFSGNLHKDDLMRRHPYNTYVNPGLPIGPICSPSRSSLLAALKPAKTDFFYFVSKNNGTHYFSKTGKEHAEAVQKYQRRPFRTPASATAPIP